MRLTYSPLFCCNSTKNFKIKEGFNLIPKQLIEEDLIEFKKESDLTLISINKKGIIKIKEN